MDAKDVFQTSDNGVYQNGNKRKPRPIWLYCKKCDKKLAKRLPNGMFEFAWGRERFNREAPPKVFLRIWGSFQITCLDPDCREVNTFTLLPPRGVEEKNKEP